MSNKSFALTNSVSVLVESIANRDRAIAQLTAEFRIQGSEFRSKTAFTPGFETLVVYLTFLEMRCKST
ncbi:MAG: hypothetical protein V7L05_04495 [Nostoc sp.]|uniref:hypothetical protein n=1 Tax=Nostoc sp. TaxID=1180 RepID=UPI002FF77B52